MANLALSALDRRIASTPGVSCYRRYVDDIVIVAEIEKATPPSTNLRALLSTYMPLLNTEQLRLDAVSLGRQGTFLELQSRKVKVYDLCGNEGLDFVSAVATDLQRVSSESRQLWDPEIVSHSRLAIRARATEGASARRVLREADLKKIANYELSATLASLRTCVSNIDEGDARRISSNALKPIVAMLEDPLRWTARAELFQEALQIALLAADWETVVHLVALTDKSWGTTEALRSSVRALRWRGIECNRDKAMNLLRDYLHRKRVESFIAAVPLAVSLVPQDLHVRYRDKLVSVLRLVEAGRAFLEADLRTLDREDEWLRGHEARGAHHQELEKHLNYSSLSERLEILANFLVWCAAKGDVAWGESAIAVFASTRPPTYYDIASRFFSKPPSPLDVAVFGDVRSVVNACRGTQYRDDVGAVIASDDVLDSVYLSVDTPASTSTRVIVANLNLSDNYWGASLTATPDLSFARFEAMAVVLAHAERATWAPSRSGLSPSVLVFPELSVPRRWVRLLARHTLRTRRYSLVAGLEYSLTRAGVRNEAIGLFLGPFYSVSAFTWVKGNPASNERSLLVSRGLAFDPAAKLAKKMIIDSNYGRLISLICSELIEARLVSAISGNVELVIAPVWNIDTTTYDHLVQSVSLQTHSYIAIANNSEYSDSRIWGPLKKRHQMNVCRLIQRDQNTVVWADLPLRSLRELHEEGPNSSEAGNWKPLPPGVFD